MLTDLSVRCAIALLCSNGREFVKRVRNQRPTWQWDPTEITAGNYYPCNALGWMVGGDSGLAVLNDRSQGCASLSDGQLEFMVHRRLLHDDGRGVGEPINEPGTDGLGLTVTGTHYVLLAPARYLAAAARLKASRVFAPVEPLFASFTGSVADYLKTHETYGTASAVAELPPNVELMTLQVSDIDKGVLLLRLAHQFGVGEDERLSAPVTVDVASLFHMSPTNVTELSLTANQAKGAHKGYDWTIKGAADAEAQSGVVSAPQVYRQGQSYNVTIQPAEIRSDHPRHLSTPLLSRSPLLVCTRHKADSVFSLCAVVVLSCVCRTFNVTYGMGIGAGQLQSLVRWFRRL